MIQIDKQDHIQQKRLEIELEKEKGKQKLLNEQLRHANIMEEIKLMAEHNITTFHRDKVIIKNESKHVHNNTINKTGDKKCQKK